MYMVIMYAVMVCAGWTICAGKTFNPPHGYANDVESLHGELQNRGMYNALHTQHEISALAGGCGTDYEGYQLVYYVGWGGGWGEYGVEMG